MSTNDSSHPREMSEPYLPPAPGERQITSAEYVELLVDASMNEEQEMQAGFLSWCERHVATWSAMGRDETWIRERVARARATHQLHQELIATGYDDDARRQLLRDGYTTVPELYDLMLEREVHDPTGPHVSRIYGTGDDLVTRYVLRQLVFELERRNFVLFHRWQGVASPDDLTHLRDTYHESDDEAFIRDLSTVEELTLALQMAQRTRRVLEEAAGRTWDELGSAMYEVGQELRSWFIATYGYAPEQSTTPRTPVTLNGPEDAAQHRRRHGGE